MKYILEGPDGAGKTYYAKHTLKDSSYSWTGRAPKTYREVAGRILDDFVFLDDGAHLNLVMDRSFIISQYVYSFIMKRKEYITRDFFIDFVLECLHKEVKIKIFLYRKSKETKLLTLAPEDMHLPIEKLNAFYFTLFSGLMLHRNIEILYIEDILKGAKNES